MINDGAAPPRVERLLELAKQHGRQVTRIDARLYPHGWRIALTASTSIQVYWSDGHQGGRMQCYVQSMSRRDRLSIVRAEAAIAVGTVRP